MNYRRLLIILLAFAGMQVDAQDLAHYKRVIKELASAKYQGRGYAKDGANKAGLFLEKEYRLGAEPAAVLVGQTLVQGQRGGTDGDDVAMVVGMLVAVVMPVRVFVVVEMGIGGKHGF